MGQRLYQHYRKRRVARLVDGFEPSHVTHDYGGRELCVAIRDPLARGWYDHDWSVPPEVVFLAEHGLAAGARVFDLGAHQGIVALLLEHLTGPSGHVVAVEASPHNAAVAAENARANGSGVDVLNAAVGSSDGSVYVSAELNASISSTPFPGGRRIRSVSIDTLADERGEPGFVLLDVEGAECLALDGAQRTLEQIRPVWAIEVHTGAGLEELGGSASQLYERFAGAGYAIWFATGANGEQFHRLNQAREIPDQRFFMGAVPS